MCSSERYGVNRHGVHIHQSGHAFHHKKAFHVSRSFEDLPKEQMSPVAAEVARVLLDDSVTPGLRCASEAFVDGLSDAKVILCFHAMRGDGKVEEILRGNFATMANLDSGFFGEYFFVFGVWAHIEHLLAWIGASLWNRVLCYRRMLV